MHRCDDENFDAVTWIEEWNDMLTAKHRLLTQHAVIDEVLISSLIKNGVLTPNEEQKLRAAQLPMQQFISILSKKTDIDIHLVAEAFKQNGQTAVGRIFKQLLNETLERLSSAPVDDFTTAL